MKPKSQHTYETMQLQCSFEINFSLQRRFTFASDKPIFSYHNRFHPQFPSNFDALCLKLPIFYAPKILSTS